jgi:hypothetical protein
MQFTPAQQRALELGAQGIGLYEPMMEQAEQTLLGSGIGTFQQGVSGLGGTTGAFDPQSYRQFYDPFVEDVIRSTEADIQRQADIERQRIGGAAVQSGAFGGSRQAVAEQELQRNAAQQMADTSARLRSAAFTGAQQQAQSAFENQMARGQTAAQIFGQLVRASVSSAFSRALWARPHSRQRSATSTLCSTSAVLSRRSGRPSSTSSVRRQSKKHTSLPVVLTSCRHLPRCAFNAANDGINGRATAQPVVSLIWNSTELELNAGWYDRDLRRTEPGWRRLIWTA